MKTRFLFVGLLTVLVFAVQCGPDEGVAVLDNADIEIFWNNDTLVANQELLIGNVDVGEEVVGASLVIKNLGQSPLEVYEISLTSSPPGALVPLGSDGAALPTTGAPWTVPVSELGATDGKKVLNIMLVRKDAAAEISGTLTIRSNSVLNNPGGVLTYTLKVVDLEPKLDPTPTTLDFNNVVKGQKETFKVTLINSGTADLNISGLRLNAPDAYSVTAGGTTYAVSADGSPVTFDTPISVPKGTNVQWDVHFEPLTPDPMPGELWVLSDDPDAGEDGTLITLRGNMTGACFTLNPKTVDFGGYPLDQTKKIPVQLTSCGTETLEVTDVSFSSDPIYSDVFGVDASTLPGVQGALVPTAENPVSLAPGEKGTFHVTFKPTDVHGFNVNGEPVLDVGLLKFTTNTFVPVRELPLSGHGLEEVCPTAVIQVLPGELVIPQTLLKLHGEASYAGFGEIVSYEWSVVQPEGSDSTFIPSNTHKNPDFVANTAGLYTFTLRVYDDLGNASCVDAELVVEVKPDEVIHVEVLWANPEGPEPDPASDVGSDLDLHFMHPFAQLNKPDYDEDGEPDGWFDALHDCFWYNGEPNWDVKTTDDDDPGLDLDDKNGAGPENINLRTPPSGAKYRVGVHYWKAHGFGPATVTVRVYLLGDLVYETALEGLEEGDLWEVCNITFDAETGEGTVSTILDGTGLPKVFADYPIPPQLPTD